MCTVSEAPAKSYGRAGNEAIECQVIRLPWGVGKVFCLFVSLFLRDVVIPEMGESEGIVDRKNGRTQSLKNKKVKLFPSGALPSSLYVQAPTH